MAKVDGVGRMTYSYDSRENIQPGEPSIGKAFSAMFSIYFSNFKAFFVFLLIFQAGIAIMNIFNTGISLTGIPFLGFPFSIISALLGILSVGGLMAMAAEARIKNHTTMSKAFSLIGKKAGAIIAVNFIVGLAILVGICLCLIPAFFAMVYLLWATVIVVVESASISDSLSRSVEYAKTQRPYLFILAYIGVSIMFGLAQVMIIGLPQIILYLGGLTLLGSSVSFGMANLIITAVSSLITIPIAAFFGPFLPIFITDYYLQAVGSPSEPMLSGNSRGQESSLNW